MLSQRLLKFTLLLALTLNLTSCKKDTQMISNKTTDLYGNEILLDKDGKVIMKNFTYKIPGIFEEKLQTIKISDSEFLQSEKERATKQLNEIKKILDSSPYKDYKPIYFDPKSEGDYLLFDKWLQLSYKAPKYGSIAPWTNSEKAYYESLKTKRERYIYLVIRSGLISAVIDLPQELIYDPKEQVDNNGNLINKEYASIYNKVMKNMHTLKSDFFAGEWAISAQLLGNIDEYSTLWASGFKARGVQSLFLAAQLGNLDAFNTLVSEYGYSGAYTMGLNKNIQKSFFIKNLFEQTIPKEFINRRDSSVFISFPSNSEINSIKSYPPFDEFGMIPYLDELIGVDWVLDNSKKDIYGDVISELKDNYINNGKLLDPRDINSTVESRKEFMDKLNWLVDRRVITSDISLPYETDWKQKDIELVTDTETLSAKVISLYPPQGYPNAPYYFTPEQLKELFHSGKLDKKLNPTIPAIYRDHFPEDLREKILKFGRDRGIKD